ncbi:transposase for insertion element IS3 [Yersinia enterocolitica]|nr:integrase core domain protein [Yersinia enterocolitica]EKA28677.1 transposase for insertion element IS3 [Yersinia enterocolitica subsp. enterocolitica WA-314]CAL13078.1 transposase for insertion element IS3 (pseudogene) [Yersinia enterocolitica subsp. enterocolitica 8081]VTP71055.1 transposase for insertion element IS3 [Yersinia enterocolitica subsp. enterocolitica]AJJ21660.1 integrase core domain protein [Yersinia enterocolitica]
MKYVFIEKHRAEFSVKAMCRVLRVARSGWYAWRLRRHQITPRQQFRLVCDALQMALWQRKRPENVIYDNACAESFFHSLKVECIHGERFASREIMRATVFNYIECDYNRWRRHSACGGLSPEQFENQNLA